MAVITAKKRFSLIGLALPVPSMLPTPSGSFDANDRAQLMFLYAMMLGYAGWAETDDEVLIFQRVGEDIIFTDIDEGVRFNG